MENMVIDGAALTAILSMVGGVLATLIKCWEKRADKKQRTRHDETVQVIQEMKKAIAEMGRELKKGGKLRERNRDAIFAMRRHLLVQSMMQELERGYTKKEVFREISLVFDSYQKDGLNGEVEDMYKRYEQLPIKEKEKTTNVQKNGRKKRK